MVPKLCLKSFKKDIQRMMETCQKDAEASWKKVSLAGY